MTRNATMGVALTGGGLVLFWAAWFTKPPVFGKLPAVIYDKPPSGNGGPPSSIPTPGTPDYTATEIDTMIADIFPAQWVRTFQCIWRRESPTNARGEAGEIGIFQIHPSNFPGLITAGIIDQGKDLYDIPTNIKAAANFFDRAGGNLAAIARNWTTYPYCKNLDRA